MFERFSDRSRKILLLAKDEAVKLQHSFIGTEHLLYGLAAEEGPPGTRGIAGQVLAVRVLTADRIEGEILKTIGMSGVATSDNPRSKSSSNGPWVTDYDAMACKTCIRVMQPYLPLTSEVARQFAMDGTVSTGVSADHIDVEHVDYIEGEVVADEMGEVIDGSVPLDA